MLWITQDRLGDDRRPVTHRFHGGRRRIDRAAVFPVSRDGHDLRALGEQSQHARLERIAFREDVLAKVGPRVVTVCLVVALEAAIGTVAVQPVEQRIVVEPVARLGRRHPLAPGLPVLGHDQRAVVCPRQGLEAGDDRHVRGACATATSSSRQSALARIISRGVRARAATSAGDATTRVRQRAREVATLSRWSE